MALETLRLVRNILLRCVVIGIAIAIVLGVATLAFWGFWIGIATTWFRTDEAYLSGVVIWFFTAIRFLLLFVLLTPALAFHWTYRSELARRAPAGGA
jgi:hypothetical protein